MVCSRHSPLDTFGEEGVAWKLIVELANRREKTVSLVTNFVNQVHYEEWDSGISQGRIATTVKYSICLL